MIRKDGMADDGDATHEVDNGRVIYPWERRACPSCDGMAFCSGSRDKDGTGMLSLEAHETLSFTSQRMTRLGRSPGRRVACSAPSGAAEPEHNILDPTAEREQPTAFRFGIPHFLMHRTEARRDQPWCGCGNPVKSDQQSRWAQHTAHVPLKSTQPTA